MDFRMAEGTLPNYWEFTRKQARRDGPGRQARTDRGTDLAQENKRLFVERTQSRPAPHLEEDGSTDLGVSVHALWSWGMREWAYRLRGTAVCDQDHRSGAPTQRGREPCQIEWCKKHQPIRRQIGNIRSARGKGHGILRHALS